MILRADDNAPATPALKRSKRVGWNEDAATGGSRPLSVTSLPDRYKKSRSPPPIKTEPVGDREIDAELFCSLDEEDRRWMKKNVLAFGIF
jgi:hypothetical protein